MSHRSTLRIAVLAAVAAGAVLVPSAAAFASDATPATPTPAPPAAATPTPAPPAAATPTPAAGEPTAMPRGGVAAGDQPSAVPSVAAPAPSVAPRGGVAAGERPAGNGSNATALYGSAIGTVLLAGAGTLVLRRRTAAHRAG